MDSGLFPGTEVLGIKPGGSGFRSPTRSSRGRSRSFAGGDDNGWRGLLDAVRYVADEER
jgi:hypothetical protein